MSLRHFATLCLGILAGLCLGAFGAAGAGEVPLRKSGGVYTVPVRINGVLTLHFLLDSGASEVQIPADVVLTLLRTGTLRDSDVLPGKSFRLADGSTIKGDRFILHQLDIGDRRVDTVEAVIGDVESQPILGQSLLSRLPSWSLDNRRRALILSDQDPLPPEAVKDDGGEPVTSAGTKGRAPTTAWVADWGGGSRIQASVEDCPIDEFSAQGYAQALSIDVPAERLKHGTEAWAIKAGRAVTVVGCWFAKEDGLAHAKFRRKKDGRTWEQDLDFKDGSWQALP